MKTLHERDDYWPRRERQLSNVGDKYFESIVEIPRISVGERQTIETLINEEALLFAKYLRIENPTWVPRLVSTYFFYNY